MSSGLREVFDQLSAYKIAQTTQEYSRIIREHQGKRAKRRIDESLERVRSFFKHFTARLLYSRSEGILLAKKMLEVEPQNLANQRIIDLVERVSPREKVLATLPQFYKNLFSGNSLISEDFWIARMPYTLAMRVGGINTTDATVNIFIILFCSMLINPRKVFCKYSRRSKLKSVWFISELTSLSIMESFG